MKFYAGIGSRETPTNVLNLMSALAKKLDSEGWTLRSGGAKGADTAFASGARAKTIFLADSANAQAIELASQFHPNWAACSDYARKLHARNMFIILGPNLDVPVSFICCWTPGGKISGGTGQALRAADHYGIEVRNLADPSTYDRAKEWLSK
jgi:hypothetical protein